MRVPVERAEPLICRGLSTLLARGDPAEELRKIYCVAPEQLSPSCDGATVRERVCATFRIAMTRDRYGDTQLWRGG